MCAQVRSSRKTSKSRHNTGEPPNMACANSSSSISGDPEMLTGDDTLCKNLSRKKNLSELLYNTGVCAHATASDKGEHPVTSVIIRPQLQHLRGASAYSQGQALDYQCMHITLCKPVHSENKKHCARLRAWPNCSM